MLISTISSAGKGCFTRSIACGLSNSSPSSEKVVTNATNSVATTFFPFLKDLNSPPSLRKMSTVVQEFAPPGNLNDLTKAQKQNWSRNFINEAIEVVKKGFDKTPDGRKILNNAPRPQVFNPRTTEKASDYAEAVISWIGFPRIIKQRYPTDSVRWKVADRSRDVQDEYCEWSVTRDLTGKITRVDFTCEGPEYWDFLGEVNPKKVVEIYKEFIGDQVVQDDLFKNGKYEPRNKWNSGTNGRGAMHLIQRNNSLFAEIELAAGSSMVREVNGRILENQQELISCGRYGQPERNSDPHIGAQVNALTRQGAMVALKDPVGLYFDTFSPQGWKTPDGSDSRDYWKIVRGDEESPVRAIFEVPESKGFKVGDIKINGAPIQFGGQIADFVRIKLTGIAQNFDPSNVVKFGCVTLQGRSVAPINEAAEIKSTGEQPYRFSTRLDNFDQNS